MDPKAVDQRRNPRVEFFLVPVEREQVPVWLFKPASQADADAGLIVNMSEGGVQVLTNADRELSAARYTVQLLLDEREARTRFAGIARRVWTRPLSKLGNVSGFEFTDAGSSAAEFLAQYRPSLDQRSWVRCLLQPVQ